MKGLQWQITAKMVSTSCSGSANHQWLNGIVAVAVAERHADQVIIPVYEVP